jgi:hypothetical protein
VVGAQKNVIITLRWFFILFFARPHEAESKIACVETLLSVARPVGCLSCLTPVEKVEGKTVLVYHSGFQNERSNSPGKLKRAGKI